MADTNWIKLNRKIWDNFIWSFEKPKYALAWIDILLQANYKDKKILFDGKVETVHRGSFITSMVKLAERWDMNRETVKKFLDLLKSEGMITYTTSNRRTLINVVNYGVFQSFEGSDPATEPTAEPATDPATEPTAEPATDPAQHKKIKEGEEGQEGKEELTVSNDTVRSTDVQRIIQSWNSLGLSQIKKIEPNTNRYTLLKARIKSYGVDGIIKAIEKIRESSFLKGGGDKGWIITFDWFIKPNNFPKVFEGNYDETAAPLPSPPTGGRREMVPSWMVSKDDMEVAQRLAAASNKKTADDPELAERVAKLKERLQNEK